MGTAGQSITLANSIIGVGILAMPFCFQQCGVLLATLILLLMGLVSRLCCYFLLKSALIARRRTFEFLAFHVFGPAGKLAVEVGIIGFLMGTCIAYFVVVGDLGPQIIAKMFNISQSDILRTSIMVIVSLVCVLPLGLLRNVDSLSNVSAATIGFYFCLVIKVITEAASQLLTGDWHAKMDMWKPSGVLQCVPIFSMALFCQTQLFEIFESLPTLSLEKMNVVTKNAINICTSVYFTLGLFGYIAFCSRDISGNILMSLSPTMANDVIKLGFVMSLAFSFPLIIFPCRASLYSFLYKKIHPAHHDHIINHSIPETTFRCITVAIVAVALFISLLIPNIELVLGLVGSTIGVLICVVFPAACFVNVTFKNTNERVLAKAVLILGLVIMVLGTYANLQAAETKLDRFDDKITQERIDKMVEDFFERMEKRDDIVPKTIDENKPKTHKETIKKEAILDSEVQPPNPVPPESQSNEKRQVEGKPQTEDKNKSKLLPIAENVADKASESHPRNLQKVNGAKLTNGDKKEEKIIETPKEEKAKPPTNQDKAQDKLDIIKQQQLIETIKQHGEEQKELIKEQKEILDEIKKTKNELKQNKKDIDDSDAKKIAVESIQQIANMAIKSLSGVTEKPLGDNDVKVKDEPLEKIANEAVQEIAKKAVETIEAIKEINEKPKPNPDKEENHIETGNLGNALNNVVNSMPVQSRGPVVQNLQGNIQNPQGNNQSPQANIESPQGNIQSPQANIQSPQGNIQGPQGNIQSPQGNIQSPQGNIQSPQVNGNNIAPVVSQNQINPVLNMPHAEALVQNLKMAIPQVNNNNQAKISNNIPANNAVNKIPNNVPLASNVLNTIPISQQVQNELQKEHNNQRQNNQQIQNKQQQNEINQPLENQINYQPPQQVNQQQQAPSVQQQSESIPKQTLNNNHVQNQLNKNEPQKLHSHSPDEPQSYKQGEDAQKILEVAKNIVEHVPLPIAMNGNAQPSQNTNNKPDTKAEDIKNENIVNDIETNGAKENVQNVEAPVRQKREVVDCTKTTSLAPQDKEICKKLIAPKMEKGSEEILSSKVDFNDAVLPKNLPIDSMIHHMRSLKSFDETGKRR
ncbi:putative sodium-coupled neutral amino acid transporter 10 isoform X2 [Pectinophora gossypiella]|uniref:putative sodium-coupled neutral amino acid transporter 10 isoform X2 n=1 Tax=Pectinophora gossypiella TaxID=13191 RepID=UPI00214EEDC1|nr:putative sodium-coupled neutral amino acid transporter 10 isoform X2 [Pectinophora gossypiella]